MRSAAECPYSTIRGPSSPRRDLFALRFTQDSFFCGQPAAREARRHDCASSRRVQDDDPSHRGSLIRLFEFRSGLRGKSASISSFCVFTRSVRTSRKMGVIDRQREDQIVDIA